MTQSVITEDFFLRFFDPNEVKFYQNENNLVIE